MPQTNRSWTFSFQDTEVSFRFVWYEIFVNEKATWHPDAPLNRFSSVTNLLKASSDILAVACIKVYISHLSAQVHEVMHFKCTKKLSNLIQEVDLCNSVGRLPRVLHQQCNKSHKGIQIVVALGSNHSGVGSGIVLLLSLSTIADFNTHFGAKTEKAGDQVICFQDSLLVHLSTKGKKKVRTINHRKFILQLNSNNTHSTKHPPCLAQLDFTRLSRDGY